MVSIMLQEMKDSEVLTIERQHEKCASGYTRSSLSGAALPPTMLAWDDPADFGWNVCPIGGPLPRYSLFPVLFYWLSLIVTHTGLASCVRSRRTYETQRQWMSAINSGPFLSSLPIECT